MSADMREALTSLGLTPKESAVYLAVLELGRGTVTQLSRAAGINRTNGYGVLDSLVSRGLVRISGKEPKQEYVAESPDRLVELLEKKTQETERQLTAARNLAPQLKAGYKVGSRPHVSFYEGEAGLKRAYEDTLTSHEPVRAFATVDDMHRGLPDYFPRYYSRRAEKGIAIRAIVPRTQAGIERAGHDREEKREIAFVPPEEFYFSPEINIYDDKVMIASWREKLGIIIQSAEIADAMKKAYELAWAEAKRLHQAQMLRTDAS